MVHVEFRFPGGRYHATPWGHHVNEGLVEWPPSPWRLVRAFIATAYTKLSVSDPVPEDHPLRRLVSALAAQTPSFSASPCPATHIRHYMPLGGKDAKTTLVLDTCAVPGTLPLIVTWPVELDAECSELLHRIVATIGYLGRAESWVEARVLADAPSGEKIEPHREGIRKGPGWEQVSLLAPVSAEEYARSFEAVRAEVETAFPPPDPKKKLPASLLKKRADAMRPHPADLFDCLTRDTAFLQQHGWSQPPGSRRVLYWRRTHSLTTAPVRTSRKLVEPAPVEAILIALASDTRRREVLPQFSRTLPQAELLHRALASRVGMEGAANCPVITGKDDAGKPLVEHQHLHILPLNLDEREPWRLDHFLLWAPMGIDARAQRAILALRKTGMKGGEKLLFATVAGMGSLKDFRSIAGKHLFGPAHVWESRTPFLPPRHIKKHGSNTVEGQVRAELASRGLPDAEVAFLTRDETTNARLHRFIRERRPPTKAPPQSCFIGLRVTFKEGRSGPIALGYGSHFGLGLFVPAESA